MSAVPMMTTIAPAVGTRMKTVATWLLVLPLLAEGVLPDVAKIEVAGLAVLAFIAIGSGRELPRRALERILTVAAVLTLVVLAYLAFGSWPRYAGTVHAYDMHAVSWAAGYVIVAVYAALFFDAGLLERVMWRGMTVVLWAGVGACLLSRVTGHLLLVNSGDGALRMTGTLAEPSSWAPVLTAVLLMALRRRSRLYVVLALAGLVLADSPVCMVVMGVTVPLYYALTGSWRQRLPLIVALAILIPAAAVFVQRASVPAWEDSRSPERVAVGRLVSGIRNVETGGTQGSNDRYADVPVIAGIVRANGWARTGAGPAADSAYFPALYSDQSGATVAANAVWVSYLFDFGEYGVAVLAVLLIVAAWRMRRYPATGAALLPFLVALLVNSDGGDTAFGVLAVVLFAFGWAQPRYAGWDLQSSHQSAGVTGAGVPLR